MTPRELIDAREALLPLWSSENPCEELVAPFAVRALVLESGVTLRDAVHAWPELGFLFDVADGLDHDVLFLMDEMIAEARRGHADSRYYRKLDFIRRCIMLDDHALWRSNPEYMERARLLKPAPPRLPARRRRRRRRKARLRGGAGAGTRRRILKRHRRRTRGER